MSHVEVVDAVLRSFDALPSHGKPVTRSNGLEEWTVLAAIASVDESGEVEVLSLATGQKCLSQREIEHSSRGRWVHDCHAEILAIRGFNRHVIARCAASDSETLLRRRFVMVSTEVPCGDASMEGVIASQQDSRPWQGHKSSETSGFAGGKTSHVLRKGREGFGELGVARTKPGRADAPATCVKSCSDKLCLQQYLSLLRAAAFACLGKPLHLDALIVPTLSCEEDRAGLHRAFESRLSGCGPLLDASRRSFEAIESDGLSRFAFARAPGKVASAKSLVWVKNVGAEVLAKCRRCGASPHSERSESILSRRAMFREARRFLLSSNPETIASDKETYAEWKSRITSKERKELKDAAKQHLGFTSTLVDCHFSL